VKGTFKTALVAAVVSAFVAAGAAVATTQAFTLGATNRVNAPSSVTNLQSNGTTVNPVDAPLLTLDNRSTTANATPLSLIASPNHAPFKVNTGVKVANLNADRLDGLDSTGILVKGADRLGAISLGSIAAHHCFDIGLSVGGAKVGQVPLIGFQGNVPLPAALILTPLTVDSPGHITARVCNPTDTDSVSTSDIGVRLITLN